MNAATGHRGRDDPIVAWKRAQVLLAADGLGHGMGDGIGDGMGDGIGDGLDVRFAGTVRSDLPYRPDDVFRCERGHRRLDPACSCGFYAVEERSQLRPSVVTTAVLEVELEGLVVRHRSCLRAERQRVRAVTFDGWCSYCIGTAQLLAGVPSLWGDLPAGWLRGVPVCARHARLFATLATEERLADVTGAEVRWDRASESRASRSLRRIYRSAGAA